MVRRENWELSGELDMRGRERFAILYRSRYWEHPALVAKFNNHVSKAVALELMELLIPRVGPVLDEQEDKARIHQERMRGRERESERTGW